MLYHILPYVSTKDPSSSSPVGNMQPSGPKTRPCTISSQYLSLTATCMSYNSPKSSDSDSSFKFISATSTGRNHGLYLVVVCCSDREYPGYGSFTYQSTDADFNLPVICFKYKDRGFLSRAPILIPGDDGKPAKRPNGPPGKFLMGNLSDLDAHGGSSVLNWFHLYKTYGPAYVHQK